MEEMDTREYYSEEYLKQFDEVLYQYPFAMTRNEKIELHAKASVLTNHYSLYMSDEQLFKVLDIALKEEDAFFKSQWVMDMELMVKRDPSKKKTVIEMCKKLMNDDKSFQGKPDNYYFELTLFEALKELGIKFN